MIRVLGPVIEARGAQVSQLVAASACSGLVTEHHVWRDFGIDHQFTFISECKEWALNFVLQNGPTEVNHIFANLIHLMQHGKSWCCKPGHMGACGFHVPKQLVHCLVCGVSCRPFSTARTGRRKGSSCHPDIVFLDAFIWLLKVLEPASAVLENVYGFGMRGNKSNSSSPMKVLLQAIDEETLSVFVVQIFLLDNATYKPFSRRRIYIVFIHRQRGGQASADMTEAFVLDMW